MSRFLLARSAAWLKAFVALVLVCCLLSFAPGSFTPGRKMTAQEATLYYFASQVGEPVLCERISWAAWERYSGLFGGGGASYRRSDCYERVAQARDDPLQCWRVRPLFDFDPWSSGYSGLACWRRTRAHNKVADSLDEAVLVRTFERMGYDIDTLRIDGVLLPAVRVRDLYQAMEGDRSALERAKRRLANADVSLSSEDQSYVAHFVAVASGDPHWCESIAATETDHASPAPSRDWCYLTVASNAGDATLCDRMTAAAQEKKVRENIQAGVQAQTALQMSLQSECRRSSARGTPNTRYGPNVPPDEAQIQRLLALLEVAVPSARNWSLEQRAVFYRDYLYALWPAPTLERRAAQPSQAELAEQTAAKAAVDVARSTLVQRLLALPVDP